MGKIKLIVSITLIFALGAVAGGFGTKVYLRYRHPLFKRDAQTRKAFILNRLTRKLALEPQQVKQLEKVVADLDQAISQRRREARTAISNLVNQSFKEMQPILTPAQQEKLEKMHRDFSRRRAAAKNPSHP